MRRREDGSGALKSPASDDGACCPAFGACLCAPGTAQGAYPGVTFQRSPDYVPPLWPEKPEAQQQMAHLDFVVNELEKAVEYAVNCGAAAAKKQFSDGWRVMLDPSGHPFCLCRMQQVMESPGFALL